jgi:DNA-binding CsgD family transcriptional regulator
MHGRHAETLASGPALAPLSEVWLLLCEAEGNRLHRRAEPEAWAKAARAWAQLGRPYPAAYARYREAEARLAAKGDRTLAASALRGALETATRLRAEPLAREVTALAARARLTLESGQAVEPVVEVDEAVSLGLTPREQEVLALVAYGRTNRQIADELFISENTAGVHVSNILGKLDVKGRGGVAALAYRLGLVDAAAMRGSAAEGARSRLAANPEPRGGPAMLAPALHSPGSPPTISRPPGRSTPARWDSR